MHLLKHRTRHSPPGTAPGTVTIQPGARKPQLDVTSFGPNAHPASIRRIRLDATESLPELPAGHTVRWLNVAGLGDAEVLQAVGRRFNIHALTLEDIAGTAHRPKAEAYDNYLFIVTQVPIIDKPSPANESDESGMYTAADEPAILATRQISVCIGTDFVITFQEQEDDVIFAPVRQRLMRHAGRLHTLGPDYLAYAILDAALDSFFPLLEDYGEVVERLEADVIEQPSMQQISRIHNLKRNLLTTRRAVWPQREMLNSLIRDETPLIAANTRLYLRDCYDHTIQLLDMIETCREIATGLVDILLSSQNNRMNEVMKVLTIIATIFIPLSFLAGVYGMNFDTSSPWNMPELGWRYGYALFWLLIIVVAGGLLLWFRHKGWLGRE